VELVPREDDRGLFARTFDRAEAAEHGIDPHVEQCNLSWNARAGTLRGLHYQDDRAPEGKLVRCVRGAVVDIVVDARPGSPTHLQHVRVELSADNRLALWVPPLFAHGYLTLVDDTEVLYQVSQAYTPGAERGLRWDDPRLGLDWGSEVVELSDKDRSWPLLEGADG
jgi:dTDP-4-dehydrorhamnose 3,5-epimerase